MATSTEGSAGRIRRKRVSRYGVSILSYGRQSQQRALHICRTRCFCVGSIRSIASASQACRSVLPLFVVTPRDIQAGVSSRTCSEGKPAVQVRLQALQACVSTYPPTLVGLPPADSKLAKDLDMTVMRR